MSEKEATILAKSKRQFHLNFYIPHIFISLKVVFKSKDIPIPISTSFKPYNLKLHDRVYEQW